MLFQPGGILPNRYVQTLAAQGELGVEIFFGLSGFLITTLLLREQERSGKVNLAAFYKRRAFRIFPAAWVYLGAILLLEAASLIPSLSKSEITSSLFFWRNYSSPGPATGHYWSLSVEEHFYLLWPALFHFIPNKKKLCMVSITAALAVAVWRVIDNRFQIAHNAFPIIPAWQFRTDLKIDAILWGCIAALTLPEIKSVMMKIGAFRAQIVAFSGATLFALLRFFEIPFAELGLAVFIPAMIISTIVSPHTLYGRMFELSGLRFIGRISFSLYLWQQVFLYVWAPLYPHPDGYGLIGWLILAGTMLCALASYYLVEQPMIALGRRLTTQGRVA